MNYLQKLAYDNMMQARGITRSEAKAPKGQGTLFPKTPPKKPTPYRFGLPGDIGPIAQDIVPKGVQQKLPFQEMLPPPKGVKPLPAPSMSNKLVKVFGKYKRHIGAGMLIGGTLTAAAIAAGGEKRGSVQNANLMMGLLQGMLSNDLVKHAQDNEYSVASPVKASLGAGALATGIGSVLSGRSTLDSMRGTKGYNKALKSNLNMVAGQIDQSLKRRHGVGLRGIENLASQGQGKYKEIWDQAKSTMRTQGELARKKMDVNIAITGAKRSLPKNLLMGAVLGTGAYMAASGANRLADYMSGSNKEADYKLSPVVKRLVFMEAKRRAEANAAKKSEGN